jgi:hypothetical protein
LSTSRPTNDKTWHPMVLTVGTSARPPNITDATNATSLLLASGVRDALTVDWFLHKVPFPKVGTDKYLRRQTATDMLTLLQGTQAQPLPSLTYSSPHFQRLHPNCENPQTSHSASPTNEPTRNARCTSCSRTEGAYCPTPYTRTEGAATIGPAIARPGTQPSHFRCHQESLDPVPYRPSPPKPLHHPTAQPLRTRAACPIRCRQALCPPHCCSHHHSAHGRKTRLHQEAPPRP